MFPFSYYAYINGTCFTCAIPNCQICSSVNRSQCLFCNMNYVLNKKIHTCESPKQTECVTVSPLGICEQCRLGYVLVNGLCTLCAGAPACQICQLSDLSQCMKCASGFLLSVNKRCIPCPKGCLLCDTPNDCLIYRRESLHFVSSSVTSLTALVGFCSPGCISCS